MSHKLCMIPGPVEFDSEVLQAMATPATSHVDPAFINAFGTAIELTRKAFFAPTGQPFIVAGSGTLTWDMTAANLIEPGEKALVVNTGIFGDWFAECLQLTAPFGDRPELNDIAAALKADKYKLVTVTHVDTSTGVLNDIRAIAKLVHEISPDTLIALDGVCSVGAEDIKMEEWGVDVVMTASQKAIGVPPGLAIMVVSQKALTAFKNRKALPTTYFGSFAKWLPIMQKYEARQPSYFATPPVQLILALETSLKQLVSRDLDVRFRQHVEASDKIKDVIARHGLQLVPVSRDIAAHSLSAVYYPEGVAPADFLKSFGESGVVIAGGLHPLHNTKYFRIGHMNVSATETQNGHLDKVIAALEHALKVTKK
ncbi:pyridoxal phosphate-dependent transferase [Entophlyctis helioformis]|nr:pyridoxal phosphate-dependent transferase [Entophlyctis helioformis]